MEAFAEAFATEHCITPTSWYTIFRHRSMSLRALPRHSDTFSSMRMIIMPVIVTIVGSLLMLLNVDKLAGSRWTTGVGPAFFWWAANQACGFLTVEVSQLILA